MKAPRHSRTGKLPVPVRVELFHTSAEVGPRVKAGATVNLVKYGSSEAYCNETRLARAHSSRDSPPAGLATSWANRSATSSSESSTGSARANGSSCERVGRAVSGVLPAADGCMAPMVWWQSCVTASRSLEAMGVSPPGLCACSGGAVQLSRISSSASCCSSRWAEPAPPPAAPETYLRADGAAPFRCDETLAPVLATGGDGTLGRSTACTRAISLVEGVRSEGCSQKVFTDVFTEGQVLQ